MFVIIAATDEELSGLLRRMTQVRRESRPGMQYFYGCMNCRDMLLVQTGVGPKKAGAAANRILKEHAPQVVVSIGAAGAADPPTQGCPGRGQRGQFLGPIQRAPGDHGG